MTPIVWAILLLIVAAGLFSLELFIPSSGVLGVLSTAALVGSVVFVTNDQGLLVGLIYLAVLAVITPLVIVAAVNYWPYTPIGRRILNLSPEDKGVSRFPVRYEDLVGQSGVALTKMLPSGSIKIEKKSYDAVCIGLPVEAGEVIEVVRVDGTRIVVQRSDLDRIDPLSPRTTGNIQSEQQPSNDRDPLSDPVADGIVDPFDDKLT